MALRELARREHSGIAVTLAWDDVEDVIHLHVQAHGTATRAEIDKSKALEAFEHPFLYVAPPAPVEEEVTA